MKIFAVFTVFTVFAVFAVGASARVLTPPHVVSEESCATAGHDDSYQIECCDKKLLGFDFDKHIEECREKVGNKWIYHLSPCSIYDKHPKHPKHPKHTEDYNKCCIRMHTFEIIDDNPS